MSETTERIGELLREAKALEAEGQCSLEHYERLVNEAVGLVEAGSVQGSAARTLRAPCPSSVA